MAEQAHLNILEQGVAVWNTWRQSSPTEKPDLSGADLRGYDLREINFDSTILSSIEGYGIDLYKANLRNSNMRRAFLQSAKLFEADLREADLREASLSYTDLSMANLEKATLVDANLLHSDLSQANLSNADLTGATLNYSILFDANLSFAELAGTALMATILVRVNLRGARLSDCNVHAAAIWKVKIDDNTTQSDIVITDLNEPALTVDSIEVAQLISMLEDNEKVRDLIDAVTTRTILILGRFSEERKRVLDAVRKRVRDHGYIPIIFDFPPSPKRNLTETIQLLANFAKLVIADITDPQSIPHELSHIVPNLPSVPIQPIILESEREYAMIEHWKSFNSVRDVLRYKNVEHLMEIIEEKVLKPMSA